jgi:hypothetical protein
MFKAGAFFPAQEGDSNALQAFIFALMQLLTVSDAETAKAFLQVNVIINGKDPNYIQPLDKDINAVFDEKKNKAFRNGTAKRWILKEDGGNLIGRIAAFTNSRYTNKEDEQLTGGIGFFDCIDNQEAAETLFNTARQWLMEQGMEAMDGPINFGERDRWWGLVIEGFKPPLYCMNYNPPYYQKLFEEYGFQVFYNQYCMGRPMHGRLPERFYAAHEKLEKKGGFETRRMEAGKLDQYAADFVAVYNKAWAMHEGGKEMSLETAQKLFRSMKPILDTDLTWFTYYKGEPVAFYLNIPDVNKIFKRFRGKFGLWQKLEFLWLKKKGYMDTAVGIVFGVAPRFQAIGVDYFMVVEAAKVQQTQQQYVYTELQWQGDFNPKIVNVSKNLEFSTTRTLATYRYLFDRTKEFKRHPLLY